MKEATGELNMTIIIVIAVAILAAFFYFTLWPLIKHNFDSNANCSKAICECPTDDPVCRTTNGKATCHMKGKKETFECPWKG